MTARCRRLAAIVPFLAPICGAAIAAERDVTPYPNGVETFGLGILPGPGSYYYNSTQFYSADRLNNSRGASSISPLHVQVVANSFRFDEVWPADILGRYIESRIIFPLVDIETLAGNRSQSKFGLGNVTIVPILLGWNRGYLHWITGVDVDVPIGNWNVYHPIPSPVQPHPKLLLAIRQAGAQSRLASTPRHYRSKAREMLGPGPSAWRSGSRTVHTTALVGHAPLPFAWAGPCTLRWVARLAWSGCGELACPCCLTATVAAELAQATRLVPWMTLWLANRKSMGPVAPRRVRLNCATGAGRQRGENE